MFRKMLPPPSKWGHAANLGEEDTAKCKAAARNVNGAASNLFKAIFQFIEVESIRKKKHKKTECQVKRRNQQNKTRQDKTKPVLGASDFSRGRNARVLRTKRHLTCGPRLDSTATGEADTDPQTHH